MNALELEASVKRGLQGLAYPAYLTGTSAIADELATRYQSQMSSVVWRLTQETLDLLEVASSNSLDVERAEAIRLGQDWMAVLDDLDRPGSPLIHDGLANFWAALGTICGELTGEASPYEAADLLVRAVTTGPGSMYDQDDSIVRLNEIQHDENDLTVAILRKYQQVIALVQYGNERPISSSEVRIQVFGHA